VRRRPAARRRRAAGGRAVRPRRPARRHLRHNPARAPEEVYRRRVEEKGFRERWPRLRFS
jgi:hypothetical protein